MRFKAVLFSVSVHVVPYPCVSCIRVTVVLIVTFGRAMHSLAGLWQLCPKSVGCSIFYLCDPNEATSMALILGG
ncbi:hypothetical protein EDB19DRAFT_1737903 [Suillus lakei]|nr:hypothetical protein EDB19DRAFT_1737903 [Suillus lakei]